MNFLHNMFWRILPKPGKVLLQEAVHEDVAAANFAQEDELGGVVQEAGVAPGQVVLQAQEPAQKEVLDKDAAPEEGCGD